MADGEQANSPQDGCASSRSVDAQGEPCLCSEGAGEDEVITVFCLAMAAELADGVVDDILLPLVSPALDAPLHQQPSKELNV